MSSGMQSTSHFQKRPHSQHAKNRNSLFQLEYSSSSMTFDFTMTAYQPSEQQRTLVQAQHRPSAKIQELNTNDPSFTLDGVLSTLQQGSAENGVGSSVELRYHVKKRRAQICLQIQRFINFLQNYAGGRVRQPRTPNTSAAHVVTNLMKLNSGSLSCQKGCFIHDSHMLTSDSFFSLQTQHDQSGKHKHNKQEKSQAKEQETCVPSVDLSDIKLGDTAASVH